VSENDLGLPEDREPKPEEWLKALKQTSERNKAIREKVRKLKAPHSSLAKYMMKNYSKEFNDYIKWHPDRSVVLPNNVDLKDTDLEMVNLKGVNMVGRRLQKAIFQSAELQKAEFYNAKLQGSKFYNADLNGAKFEGADLRGAEFMNADIRGADFIRTQLENTDFTDARVDGGTRFSEFSFNTETNFSGVGLASAMMAPWLRQEFKYNIRRRRWEEWYENHRFLRWPVRRFWNLSDYGQSTMQLIKRFCIFAIAFAIFYYAWGAFELYALGDTKAPGVVEGLFVKGCIQVRWYIVPLRAVYFSVVTMTTLGFGDMYAMPGSIWGHILLMIQVLLGYVLLGALITRFAIMFQEEGPRIEQPKRKKDNPPTPPE